MLRRLGSMVHRSPRPPRIPAWEHTRSCWERLDLGREKGRIWAGSDARLGQEMGQDLGREQGRIGMGFGQDQTLMSLSPIHSAGAGTALASR